MKDEAEANAESDRKFKEEAEKVNQADSLIFQTEKQLSEFGDKIPAEKKTVIENALAQLKEAHKNRDITAIDTALATLNAGWQAASQDMYNATQEAGAQPGSEANENPQGSNESDNVTDVDFEEVKEDKK